MLKSFSFSEKLEKEITKTKKIVSVLEEFILDYDENLLNSSEFLKFVDLLWKTNYSKAKDEIEQYFSSSYE